MNRCTKPDGCECNGTGAQVFCEHLNSERLYDVIDLIGIDNWMCIPTADRERCVNHLRMVMGDHPKVLERWRDQKRRGVAPGSDDVRFHFTGGMAVRNVLRQVMLDHSLPGPEDQRNWDDFYVGAIDEIACEAVTPISSAWSGCGWSVAALRWLRRRFA